MASILMGVITAMLISLSCGGCFYAGYKVGYTNQPKTEETEKQTAEPTEEQKKIAEGLTNILNYTNRHKAGGK